MVRAPLLSSLAFPFVTNHLSPDLCFVLVVVVVFVCVGFWEWSVRRLGLPSVVFRSIPAGEPILGYEGRNPSNLHRSLPVVLQYVGSSE